MKNHLLLTLLVALNVALTPHCQWDRRPDAGDCLEIRLDKSFTAELGTWYCLEPQGWKMRLGPVLEDSRCNHPLVDCVWAGRLLMAVNFDDGIVSQDTFNTLIPWTDTLISGPFTIILRKIYPEIHIPGEVVDSNEYAFDIIVQ